MSSETTKRNVGTVTVLFTDVVGSTELLDRVGDDAADRVRRKHFKRLRQLVRALGGREVKSLGDGLMVVFSSATDAAACAVAIQQATAADPDALPVRVGLHTGEAAWEENDLYGGPVVVARRLCDRARGGQILASDLVRGLIGRRGSFSFNDLGFLELKGFQTAVSTAEILWRGHATEFIESALAGLETPRRSNLATLITLGVIVIVANLAVFWIIAGDNDSVGVTRPIDSRASFEAKLRSLSLRWSSEDLGTLAGGTGEQIMLDVTHHRGRLFVPGRDEVTGDVQAALWVRGRRGDWSKVYPDGVEAMSGDQMIFAVAGRGRMLVAVGADTSSGTWDAATWVSKDLGRRWKRTNPGLQEPGDEVIFSVADDGSRFIAVGYASDTPDRWDAAVWSSRDGHSWSRVTDAGGTLAGQGRNAARDVLATEDGFIAVGNVGTALPDGPDAMVWTSTTGKTWERIENPTFARPRGQAIMSVVPWRGGFLAGGYDSVAGDMEAALWSSPDGTTWERLPYHESVFGGPNNQIILALAEDQGLLTAAGMDGTDGGEDAAVWLSFTGGRWRRMPSDENVIGGDGVQVIRGVILDDREILAVGANEEVGDPDASVWRAKVEGL